MRGYKPLLVWTVVGVTLIAVVWVALLDPVQLVTLAVIKRGQLEQSFLAEGKTRLKKRYVITAPVSGILHRIHLQNGDSIKEGQEVAQIEPISAALLDVRAHNQALVEVDSRRSALDAARMRISAAETGSQVAQKELERAVRLAENGIIAKTQFDQMQAKAANAVAELSTAQAEALIAEQRLKSAQDFLRDEGRSRVDRVFIVRAPADGVIIKRSLDSATPVALGQSLLELGDPQFMELEVEVLSTDAVRIVAGCKARVVRWGGESILNAKVSRIERGGFTKVSALGVEEQRTRVILDFTSPHQDWAALGDAYRVEVEFVLQQAQDVILIPTSALFRHGEGWAAFLVSEGVVRIKPLQLGIRSASEAQVLSGLLEGQQVVIQPDDRLKDGIRVRAIGGKS